MKELKKVRPVYMSCNLELQDEIKPTLKDIIKLFVNEPKELKKSKDDNECCTEICLIKTPYADVVRTMDSDGQHEFIMFPKDSLDESEWKNHKYNEERVYIEECEGYAPKYFAVPFCDGQTATVYFDIIDVLDADINQTNLSYEQALNIYENNKIEVPDNFTLDNMIADIMYFGEEDVNGNVYENFTYCFDTLAIIDICHLDKVHLLAEDAFERFGSDSSTYSACEDFNESIKNLASKLIKLQCNIELKD